MLSALPRQWQIFIIDIKDCFFSIPLHPQDRCRFAFSVPTINHAEPDRRYQWKVLPQGMANSPTLCQLYVQEALTPVKEKFPQVKLIHYMDDILLCHPLQEVLQAAFTLLRDSLTAKGLYIATDKIQQSQVGKFLGAVIHPNKVMPQRVELLKRELYALHDFQRLLGDINWLRPFLKITSAELKPLYDLLEGDPCLSSPRRLTPQAVETLKLVERALTQAQLQRIDYSRPFVLCVLKTRNLPTAVLWQEGPLLWIHPHASPQKMITWYPAAVAQLALKGLKTSVEYFGLYPASLIIPYTNQQVQILAATDDDWAILTTIFLGFIDNHYPKHPILQFASYHPLVFPHITSPVPVKDAITVFTDGSKTGIGAYVVEDKVFSRDFGSSSPQVVECRVVLEVLKKFECPLNIVSDSCYVVNALKILEVAGLIKPSSTVFALFCDIQDCLLKRATPFFITHIRAHTGLPGPLTAGNDLADRATRLALVVIQSAEQSARDFHAKFHVTAETLRKRFDVTRQQARDIVTQCQNCCQFLPVRHTGVNPRGIQPLQLWQMDVTHIPFFGKLQYVHVSIDTCSGIVHATPLTGEKTIHVIQHCLEAWSAWGKPSMLKTDNGPAYASSKFKQFCAQMQVTHVTGLPYNPQGQGIVERANRTLKSYLLKQKGGMGDIIPTAPRVAVSLALFIMNF